MRMYPPTSAAISRTVSVRYSSRGSGEEKTAARISSEVARRSSVIGVSIKLSFIGPPRPSSVSAPARLRYRAWSYLPLFWSPGESIKYCMRMRKYLHADVSGCVEIFRHVMQQVRCVKFVMFLWPPADGPNVRSVSDTHLVLCKSQHSYRPLAVSVAFIRASTRIGFPSWTAAPFQLHEPAHRPLRSLFGPRDGPPVLAQMELYQSVWQRAYQFKGR